MKGYIAVPKPEADGMTVEELRDLHRNLGRLGFRADEEKAKLDFFAAQFAVEKLIEWKKPTPS